MVYRCGGNFSTKDILRKLKYADDLAMVAAGDAALIKPYDGVDRHVQQTHIGSRFGEVGTNVSGAQKERSHSVHLT